MASMLFKLGLDGGLKQYHSKLSNAGLIKKSVSVGSILLAGLLLSTMYSSVNAQSGKTGEESVVREVTFESDTITLAGILTLPVGGGPFPIVIWAHGSGKSNRKGAVLKIYTKEFLERGIATLNPDKRGCDGSGGDWKVASYYDLADDVKAAIEYVLTLPEVDQERIILLGGSQGSQIVSVAGSHPAVDRVISFSGSVAPFREALRDEVRLMGHIDGLSDEQINTADSLYRLALAFSDELAKLSSQDNWEDDDMAMSAWNRYSGYLKELRQTEYGEKETIADFPSDSNHYIFRFVNYVGDFDPIEHWSKVTVPILFMYGARDTHVNVSKSIGELFSRFDHLLKHYTILMFGTQRHMFIREDEMDFIARWIVEDD